MLRLYSLNIDVPCIHGFSPIVLRLNLELQLLKTSLFQLDMLKDTCTFVLSL